jgi:F-type H+-transporting ATPase subunit epsilon
MTKTIRCDIVSAHEEIFSGEVKMVFATGIAGELGISPRHAPLITQLKPGPVRIQDVAGEEQFFFVTGGIIEVQPHVVTVMADTAMRGEDLDQAAAEAAKAEAERELADRTGEMEIAEAQSKLLEAVAQLQALERLRKNLKR